jgi:hypothetical protein
MNMKNTITYFVFVFVIMFLNSCITSQSSTFKKGSIYSKIPIKLYSTRWYDSSDSGFKNPGDTVSFSLMRYTLDTLVYPPWYSPGTNIDYVLTHRSNVSLEIFSKDGKTRTHSIQDTLEQGNYSFDLNANRMVSGLYYYRKIIGMDTTIKRFILLK